MEQQKIQVIVENIIKGQEKLDAMTIGYRKMGNQFRNITRGMVSQAQKQAQAQEVLAKKQQFLATWSDKLGVNTNMVNKAMSSLGWTFDSTGGLIDKAGRGVKNIEKNMRTATVAVKPFKFEFLSVMFAGMAIQRVVSGLLRTSLKWTGVWDVLSNTLGVLFLPIAELLLDWALKFMDWVFNLTPEQQKLIGLFVLLAGAIGGIALIFGQVGLAISGVAKLFPLFAGNVASAGGGILGFGKTIIGVFARLSAPILAVIGIIVAIVIGMYLAWKTNFLNMKQTVQNFIDGFKQFFGGIINIVKGIIDIVKGIFTGDFTLVTEGIKKIFKGLFDFLVGGFKAAFNLVVGIIKGALKIIYNIIKVIIDGIGWIVGKVGGIFGGSGAPAWKMPSFQTGGIMPYTGLAMLHKGETITPAGESNTFSPNITINATVSSDYDVRRLSEQLKKYWTSDYERLTMSRGVS